MAQIENIAEIICKLPDLHEEVTNLISIEACGSISKIYKSLTVFKTS